MCFIQRLCSFCIVCAIGMGQELSRDAVTDEFLAVAASSAAEIGADLILHGLEQGVINPKRKLELLNVAEGLIWQVKYPARIQNLVAAGRTTDSSIGMLTMGLDRRLDRRSLTARLVDLYLPLSPEKARGALEAFASSPLTPLSCSEGYAWRGEDEVHAARAILERGFSSAERKKGLEFRYLIDFINRMDNVSQVEPILELLVLVPLSSEQMQEALSAVGSFFARTRTESRSLQVILSPSIGQRFRELSNVAQKRHLNISAPLSEFRKLLLRAALHVRCGDSDIVRRVDIFMVTMRTVWDELVPVGTGVEALPEREELISKESKGNAIAEVYWQSNEDKPILDDFRKMARSLNAQKESETLSEETVRVRIRELLRKIIDWRESLKGQNLGRSDSFNKVCVIYQGLVDMVPDSELQFAVAQEYISFLSLSGMALTEPVLWYFHVQVAVASPGAQNPAGAMNKAMVMGTHSVITLRRKLCVKDLCNSGSGITLPPVREKELRKLQ